MKKLSKKTINEKIITFCNYRERCSKEILNKLFSLGCSFQRSNKILNQLIKINLVNDLRFAKSFCRGKHSINKWGKVKIKLQLINKEIKEKEIKEALNSIDMNQYYNTIKNLLITKKSSLTNKEKIVQKQKIFNYLLQKGYENNLILECLNKNLNI